MRLWHYQLIPKLPRQQLLGQWRECIALLGNGWGRKHSTVDYVFRYNEGHLLAYTLLVSCEMKERGYKPDNDKVLNALKKRLKVIQIHRAIATAESVVNCFDFYNEHNDDYYKECLENLKEKGIEL